MLRAITLFTVLLPFLPVGPLCAGEEQRAQIVEPPAEMKFDVKKTFDGKEFSCEMKLLAKNFGYHLYRFKFPSPVVSSVPSNNTVYGKYYWPVDMKVGGGVGAAADRRPAVVCLHILGRDFTLIDILCSALAGRGIPAAMIELPYYGERMPPQGFNAVMANSVVFVEALSQGVQDTRRTIDMLQARPEINPERIGVAGISLGGILTGTTAVADERVYRTAMIIAGGNLPIVIASSRETKQLREAMQKLSEEDQKRCQVAIHDCDPLTNAARLRERAMAGRVLMVNATEDEVIPRQCTEQLADALGMKDKIRWLNGLTHYTALAALPNVLGQVCDFYAVDLPPSAVKEQARPAKTSPENAVALVMKDLSRAILFPQDDSATCCFIDLELTAKTLFKQPATLRYLRSGGSRFRLEGNVPVLGKIAAGQGEFPWMLSKNGVLFKGTGNVKPGRSPLAFADASAITKATSLTGVLTGFALFPAAMDVLANFKNEPTAERIPAVRIHAKSKDAAGASALLTFDKDGVTPRSIHVEMRTAGAEAGATATADLSIRQWQTSGPATPQLFEPPQAEKVIEVEQEELQRIFSAFFSRAAEEAN